MLCILLWKNFILSLHRMIYAVSSKGSAFCLEGVFLARFEFLICVEGNITEIIAE